MSDLENLPPARRCVAFCIESLTVGGAEQLLIEMANQLADQGWQVHMVLLTEPGELASLLSDKVIRHVLDKRPGIDWRLPRRLRSLIRSIKPDVINAHLWTANFWTRFALVGFSTPIIVTEHNRNNWKPLHYRILDRLLIYKAHTLIAVSADTADFYLEDIGIPKRYVLVINNGVDTRRYAVGDGRELREQWAPNGEFLVGTVARLTPQKNHLRMLDMAQQVASEIESFKLVIVGDGPSRQLIADGIAERKLEDHVHLAGARSDIPDVLAAFDLFVLSSDREGHPLAALEAQAAGTPVVLTRAGGSADAIARDGDQVGGLLVDIDAGALAEAVCGLARDAGRLAAMAEFAQSHALARFDKTQMIDQYAQLFVKAIGAARA